MEEEHTLIRICIWLRVTQTWLLRRNPFSFVPLFCFLFLFFHITTNPEIMRWHHHAVGDPVMGGFMCQLG